MESVFVKLEKKLGIAAGSLTPVQFNHLDKKNFEPQVLQNPYFTDGFCTVATK